MEESHIPNVRRVIQRNGEIDEYVGILWEPGSESTIHDHGASAMSESYPGSHGVTKLHFGDLYVKTPDGKVTYYKAGDTFTEEPGTVHQVGSINGAISEHHYTPPLTGRSKFFAEFPAPSLESVS